MSCLDYYLLCTCELLPKRGGTSCSALLTYVKNKYIFDHSFFKVSWEDCSLLYSHYMKDQVDEETSLWIQDLSNRTIHVASQWLQIGLVHHLWDQPVF